METSFSLLTIEGSNFRQAVAVAIKHESEFDIVSLCKTLLRPFVESGLVDDFAVLAAAGISIARINEDRIFEGEILGLQGIVAKRSGSLVDAYSNWTKRRQIGEDIGDLDIQADSLCDLLELAIDNHEKNIICDLIRLYETLKLVPNSRQSIQRELFQARSQLILGNFEKSEELANDIETASIKIFDSDDHWTMYVLYSLADIFRQTGNLEKAILYSKRLLRLCLEIDFASGAGRALIQLARIGTIVKDAQRTEKAICALNSIPRHFVRKLQDEAHSMLTAQGLRGKASNQNRIWKELAHEALEQ